MSEEETNQEDLSVEDILSSIKNILVDENGEPIEETVEPEATSIPEPKEEKDEPEEITNEIFNLDDSMILNDENPSSDISQLLDTPNEEPILEINDLPNVDNLLTETETTENELPETEEETDLPNEEETVDASASIINNFAKVFAEKQQEHTQPTTETSEKPLPIAENIQSAIKDAGITEMVKEAITNQVRLSLDSHFEQIASNIIAEETKKWINANLASIVGKTVEEQIERVIAKVGS